MPDTAPEEPDDPIVHMDFTILKSHRYKLKRLATARGLTQSGYLRRLIDSVKET
jgi:hypothetical protein